MRECKSSVPSLVISVRLVGLSVVLDGFHFTGRTIRHRWRGTRVGHGFGYYHPVAFYETDEFRAQAAASQQAVEVRARQLHVTVVPYHAISVGVPAGVAPGGLFSITLPGTSTKYMIAAPPNSAPGVQVSRCMHT